MAERMARLPMESRPPGLIEEFALANIFSPCVTDWERQNGRVSEYFVVFRFASSNLAYQSIPVTLWPCHYTDHGGRSHRIAPQAESRKGLLGEEIRKVHVAQRQSAGVQSETLLIPCIGCITEWRYEV